MQLLLPRSLTAGRTNYLHLATLGLILLVAAMFRFHGLTTWDDDQHQHPDERFLVQVSIGVAVPDSLANYLNTQRSTLNPYAQGQQRYAYGQLPLTLTRLLAEWTGNTTYDTVEFPGRVLSALFDLLTILFAWLLARRAFGVRVAHLTALLLALTVLHIQLAHYYAVDTFVATFAAASLVWRLCGRDAAASRRSSCWTASPPSALRSSRRSLPSASPSRMRSPGRLSGTSDPTCSGGLTRRTGSS